jgi:hypothetical protein
LFVVVYALILLAAIAFLFLLGTGRLPKEPRYVWTLCAACLWLGEVASSAATPDWSPLSFARLFVPFILVAIAAGVLGVRWGRGSRT